MTKKHLSKGSGSACIKTVSASVYFMSGDDHQAAAIVGLEIENDVMIAARPPLLRLPDWAAVFDAEDVRRKWVKICTDVRIMLFI
jgi:hypothetical protein